MRSQSVRAVSPVIVSPVFRQQKPQQFEHCAHRLWHSLRHPDNWSSFVSPLEDEQTGPSR